jgi:hypothetical protein
VPLDRVTEQKPYYSGKHKRHGVNVQVVADPAGRLVWAAPALPGAVTTVSRRWRRTPPPRDNSGTFRPSR